MIAGSNPGGCAFGTLASFRCLLSTRCLNRGIIPVSTIPCPSGMRHPAGAKPYKREACEYVAVCAAPSSHSGRGLMDKASASESKWLWFHFPGGALLAAGAWLFLTQLRIHKGRLRIHKGRLRIAKGRLRIHKGRLRIHKGRLRIHKGRLRIEISKICDLITFWLAFGGNRSKSNQML